MRQVVARPRVSNPKTTAGMTPHPIRGDRQAVAGGYSAPASAIIAAPFRFKARKPFDQPGPWACETP